MKEEIKIKVCKKCKEEKCISEFYKNNSNKDEYNINCKQCIKEYKIWNKQNGPILKHISKEGYKLCSTCKEEKLLIEFSIDNSCKDNLNCWCRLCESKRNKKAWRNKHPIKEIKIICQEGYKFCNFCNIEKTIIEFPKIGFRCKKCVSLWHKEYASRPDIKERLQKNLKKRVEQEPLLKMAITLRARVRCAFKNKGIKKVNKTEKILGCTFEEVKIHIEQQFVEGMTWENHTNFGWHIDHIIPLVFAKTEEELIKLCHYTNLQPLWWYDNLSKRAKIHL